MQETWKVLPGYRQYRVSNLGRVKWVMPIKQRSFDQILPVTSNKQVRISDGRFLEKLSIPLLVLLTFVGNPPQGKHYVAHIKGRRRCRLMDLEWSANPDDAGRPALTPHYEIGYARIMLANARSDRHVGQYSINGELICKYLDDVDASMHTRLPHRDIKMCSEGVFREVGGFRWAYTV